MKKTLIQQGIWSVALIIMGYILQAMFFNPAYYVVMLCVAPYAIYVFYLGVILEIAGILLLIGVGAIIFNHLWSTHSQTTQ